MGEADFSSGENFAKSLTPELFGFAFAIPALLGLGNHWYLNDAEQNELSESGWVLVGSLPKADRKQFEKWLNKYLPALMFFLVTSTIVGKRIAESIKLMQAKKPLAKVIPMPTKTGDNNNEPSSANAGGSVETATTESTASVKGVISDPFSEAFGGIAARTNQ